MIAYRLLTQPQEFDAITDLEMLVWDMAPREAVPSHMTQVIGLCGGHILGAYDEAQLVGFSIALAARSAPGWPSDAGWLLWSHMAAVHPNYQRQGIGRQLKVHQRTWAIANGYDVIGWTYNPLLRQNANFNLRVLGAYASTYKPNHYGVMNDGLNAGLPSDRLIVTWKLDDERVSRHVDGAIAPLDIAPLDLSEDLPFALVQDRDYAPVKPPVNWDLPAYGVEIPYDFQAMRRVDQEKAMRWLYIVRETLVTALDCGYTMRDFVTTPDRCWYILTRDA